MTERQQKRNAAGQGRKTARPEQLTRKAPETAHLQERRNPRRTPRMHKMRRKRIKSTVILILFLIVVFAGTFGGFYVLRGGSISTPAQAYDITREFQHQSLVGTSQRASAFAADLCVVDGDQPMDSVSLEDGQEGVLLDLKDKSVLFAQNAYERVYPASITKIITALLAFKNSNMDDVVTISQENITLEEGSQVVGFQEGDQVTMDQLVHCLLVYSGNDAASAIATHVGGTTENFVSMMNEYAAQLGCTGTHFTNPHGLQDENHYTTPYDIYLMLNEAMNYKEFTQITQMPSYTVTYTGADGESHSISLEATDHYLTGEATPPKDVTVLGGKTGTTASAGNCLAIITQNAFGKPFVSIVLGASSKELLYQQMNSLLQNINS